MNDLPSELIVESFTGGYVLAEGVVGKKNFVLLYVGHHGIRPVDHGDLHKGQGLPSKFKYITGLHHRNGDFLPVVLLQLSFGPGTAQYLHPR